MLLVNQTNIFSRKRVYYLVHYLCHHSIDEENSDDTEQQVFTVEHQAPVLIKYNLLIPEMIDKTN